MKYYKLILDELQEVNGKRIKIDYPSHIDTKEETR